MITYRWLSALDGADLADVQDLIRVAAEYDAEAGFSTASPLTPGKGASWHLVVGIAPQGDRGSDALNQLPDVAVVAYARILVADGEAQAQFLVRPEFRSHGVTTLLLEQLAEDPDGWGHLGGVSVVRVWAHGAHPAAERCARRFGAQLDHGVFKTVRLIGRVAFDAVGVSEAPGTPHVTELVEGHWRTMAPADYELVHAVRMRIVAAAGEAAVGIESADDHPRACIAPVIRDGCSEEDLRAVLVGALSQAQNRGARAAVMYVDPLNEPWLWAARAVGFEHEQSDLLYAFRP